MSRRRVEIDQRARREIHQATRWWRENRTLAPHLLEEDIECALGLIAEQNRAGSRIGSRRFVELRRFPIGKSGYWMYYSIDERGPVVLSLWHESRGRGPQL